MSLSPPGKGSSVSKSKLSEGDRISNYLLEAPLGSGSFGEVWRAHHHVFNDVVAIKVPTDPQFVRNLRREGVAVRGLNHPNIVSVIDLDPYGDPPYMVMECVDGPSLRAVVDEFGAEFPIAAAVAIMGGMLHALAAAHDRGVIHRDVKPANIMLNHPADQIETVSEQSVKITDFGLGHVGGITTQSIMQSGSATTEDGRSIAGTLAYMSPEQKEGQELDARSDLYSCGIVLFEMLTGERPQGNDAPSSLRRDVPAHLDRVFQRCYTRRDRRYNDAREMMADLATRAAPPPPPVPAPRRVGPGGGNRCPACDTAVHSDDQFCIKCRYQLVETVPRCPKCQAYVRLKDRFCDICGTNLQILT